jgi:hypothetical protein
MKKTLLYLWLTSFVGTFQLFAQEHFTYQTETFTAQRTGYNRIELVPEIVNQLSIDFGNLRLYNEAQKEVEYVIQGEIPLQHSCSTLPLSLYSKINKEGRKTEVIFENTQRNDIDNLTLHLKSFVGQKTLQLSGSNDHERWEVLKDKLLIHQHQGLQIPVYHFRRTSFRYFKITTDDFDSSPIQIEKVTYQTTLFPKESYHLIASPPLTVSQTVNNRDTVSYVEVALDSMQYVNWIDIQAECNSADYAYNIEVQTKQEDTGFYEHYQTLQLTPQMPLQLVINKLKTKYLRLKIPHYRHASPTVTGVQLYQLRYYLVANMTQGKKYQLRFGGNQVKAPLYANMMDKQVSIAQEDFIYPHKIMPIEGQKALFGESQTNSNPYSVLTWFACIGGVVLSIATILVVFRKKFKKASVS